jgi:hypothetical protein
LPEYDDFTSPQHVFPYVVWLLFVVVALANSAHRWSTTSLRRERTRWLSIFTASAALLFVLIMLPELAFITYLVHVATAGIEAAQPLAVRRVGTFPDPSQGGFPHFWFSAVAMMGVLVCCPLLLRILRRPPESRWISIPVRLLVGVLMTLAVSFDIWYWGGEYARVSPDIAASELVATWPDWLGAAILVAVFAAAVAFRVSKREKVVIDAPETELHRWRQPRIHETAICVCLTVLASVWFLYESGWMMLDFQGGMHGVYDLMQVFSYMLEDAPHLFYFAACILAVQVGWLRRRNRGEDLLVVVEPICLARFCVAFCVCLVFSVIALATIAAYSFCYWLGPWYLLETSWG